MLVTFPRFCATQGGGSVERMQRWKLGFALSVHNESPAGSATQAPASEVTPASVQAIATQRLPIGAQRPQLSLQQYWLAGQVFFPQAIPPPAPPPPFAPA